MTFNEEAIVSAFRRTFGARAPRDDAEYARIGGGRVAVKVDTFVGSTDMPASMRLRDAGWKSVAACVSDMASKGVRPTHGAVSVVMSRSMQAKSARELAGGIGEAARAFGISIEGGDTNEGADLAISVCLIGAAPQRTPPRCGARTGDIIMATGQFGYAAAGLMIAMEPGLVVPTGTMFERALSAFMRPRPKLDFCVAAARMFTSSMDASDGLAATLAEMAGRRAARFVVSSEPFGPDLRDFARDRGHSADMIAYEGGEDYETVFTCRPRSLARVRRLAAQHGVALVELGRVERGFEPRARRPAGRMDDAGVFRIRMPQNRPVRLRVRGWRYFARHCLEPLTMEPKLLQCGGARD